MDEFTSWYTELQTLAKKYGENVSDKAAWRKEHESAKSPEKAFYDEYPEHKGCPMTPKQQIIKDTVEACITALKEKNKVLRNISENLHKAGVPTSGFFDLQEEAYGYLNSATLIETLLPKLLQEAEQEEVESARFEEERFQKAADRQKYKNENRADYDAAVKDQDHIVDANKKVGTQAPVTDKPVPLTNGMIIELAGKYGAWAEGRSGGLLQFHTSQLALINLIRAALRHATTESGLALQDAMIQRYFGDTAESVPVVPEGWISVNDRLPEDETPVLIIISGKIRIAERLWEYPGFDDNFKAYWFWDDPVLDGQDWTTEEVTYWMPLPTAPTVEAKGGVK